MAREDKRERAKRIVKTTEAMKTAKKRRLRICRWRRQGLTFRQIGENLGISRGRAYGLFRFALRRGEYDPKQR